MKWLHEDDVDLGSHADLNAIISDIDTGEGYTDTTYGQIQQHPFIIGSGIAIDNTQVESYLTASEISALESLDDQLIPRNSDLPESEPEMIVLARFLDRLVEADYTISDTPYLDHTYVPAWETSDERTYQLWKCLPPTSGFPASDFMQGFWYPASDFVLSNVENAGTIQMNFASVRAGWLGWWAEGFNYPGNPWHSSNNPSEARALKLRFIAATFIDLIMAYDNGNTDHYRWQVYGMYGYMLDTCKDVIPPFVKNAFISLMQKAYFSFLESNHYGLQTTLDQLQRLGVLFLALNSNSLIEEKWLDIFVTKSLFNLRDPKIAQSSLDHDGGVDLGYQGRTDLFTMWSYVVGKKLAPSKVTHLASWMQRFMDFQSYQIFPEADGPNGRTYYGPTGVNVGTGPDETQEQDNFTQKYLDQAYHFGQNSTNDGLHNAWRYSGVNNSPIVPDIATMQTEISDTLSNINQFWFDEAKKLSGPISSWNIISTPTDVPSLIFPYYEEGEFAFLEASKLNLSNLYVEDADSDIIKPKFQRSVDFVEAFGTEFLAAKLNSGTSNEFGVQIYTQDVGFRGSIATPVGDTEIAGFRGGISGLWHKNIGTIMISRMRGQQLDDRNDRLDASVSQGFYAGWYTWCDNHIGGILSDGSVFTTAFNGRTYSSISYTVDSTSISTDQRFSGNTDFSITASDDLTPMRKGYNPISGQVDYTHTFEGNSTGVTKTTTITADATAQTENINELWEFLPLVISAPGQSATFDRTISYSTDGGSTYNNITGALDTIVTGVDAIEISATGGAVYIVPDATEHPSGWRMQFDSTLWQTAQDFGDVRICRVDLHGNPGNSISFPASTTVKWKYQTAAP